MSYSYSANRARLFTEKGSTCFMQVRDKAKALLRSAGAFEAGYAWRDADAADTDMLLACLDRLVELKEIERVSPDSEWGQHQIYRDPHRGGRS